MKKHEKALIFTQFIELLIECGYSITPYLGVPFNKFDFEKIENRINELLIEAYNLNN